MKNIFKFFLALFLFVFITFFTPIYVGDIENNPDIWQRMFVGFMVGCSLFYLWLLCITELPPSERDIDFL